MLKSKLICFTGMDGSGKTSHAFALLKRLEKKGFRCKYAWCRWHPGLADVFHFFIRKTIGYTADQYKFCKPLQIIFPYLKFLDLIIPLFFKVRSPAMRNYVVIIDRYIYDILADLCFLGFDISPKKFFVMLFLKMNPMPNVIFFIDVPSRVAASRKNDLSPAEAMKYEDIYNEMAKIYCFRRITNIDFHKAHNGIFETIQKLYLWKA